MPPIVTDVYRYPVKSSRGQRLRAARVQPWGLAGDRRWMIVDSGGEVVTARERPRLVLVNAVPASDGIRLTEPAMPDLRVPVPPAGELVRVAVGESKLLATPAGGAASAWFSEPSTGMRSTPHAGSSRQSDRTSESAARPGLPGALRNVPGGERGLATLDATLDAAPDGVIGLGAIAGGLLEWFLRRFVQRCADGLARHAASLAAGAGGR